MNAKPNEIAKPPAPPYFAVIFSSQRTEGDRGYERMADRMIELASMQPGFLGVESARDSGGFGITVSYWATEGAIAVWKAQMEHVSAQEAGKRVWYADYQIRISRVERTYGQAKSS